MPESDLALLTRAARTAAKLALSYVPSEVKVDHKEADGSPVTEADMAVDAALRDMLCGARPDYGWLSEESADSDARLSAKRCFVVDPIDGTRAFIEGSDHWAHSLAVVEDGVPVAAVILLPRKDRLYAAARGDGASVNDAPLSVTGTGSLDKAHVLATRPALDPVHWRAAPQVASRSHRPSIAYRLGLVAEGRYDAMLTLRPAWEWDIAAGALILSEAGAVVSDRFGAPLRFNRQPPRLEGVVTAGAALHADILTKLRRLP